MNITDLIERLKKAEGPDRQLDYGIFCAFAEHEGFNFWLPDAGHMYTSSLDAATALAGKALPGWGWRVATCAVSDDAWVFPDFNSPVHGERLKREFREDIDWAGLTDVDLRPAGRPAIALCIAILKAKQG